MSEAIASSQSKQRERGKEEVQARDRALSTATEQSMSGFGGGWSGPSSAKDSPAPPSSAPSQKKPAFSAPAPPAKVGATNAGSSNSTDQQPQKYHALVVDSGAIIKHSAFSTLHNAAETYYTVPAVLDEIRDAKAREHSTTFPSNCKRASRRPRP